MNALNGLISLYLEIKSTASKIKKAAFKLPLAFLDYGLIWHPLYSCSTISKPADTAHIKMTFPLKLTE